jgi:outer membrane protein assembly factor BamD (BamD/ComL family)
MIRNHTKCLLVLALLLAAVLPVLGGKPYEAGRPGGKMLGVLGGPEKDAPEDQYAYASGLEQDGKLKAAGKAYRQFVANWPDHDLAPEAQFRYARVLEQRGKEEKAFHAYQELVDTYPAGFPYEYGKVLDRQYEIASRVRERRHMKFLIFPGYRSPARALELYDKIVANAPRRSAAWKRGPEVGFVLGQLHEEMGDHAEAAAAYLDTLVRYPDSEFAERAFFRRTQCLVEISEDSPYNREAAEQAYHALSLFSTTYPVSEYVQDAGESMRKMYEHLARGDFEVARFYDKHTRKPEAAVAAYESFVDRFPASAYTAEAKARIKVLNQVVEERRERR